MFSILKYRKFSTPGSGLIPLFAVILFLCGFIQETFATHIVGGNLYYECLGNNRYRVVLEFRRDCYLGAADAQFDNPASIGIFDGNGSLQIQLGLGGQIRINFNGSDTLNQIFTSECRVEGTDVCVHTTTYSTIVNLPPNDDGYILAYERCCRNSSLNNIVNPLETGGTYWTYISGKALKECNDSPAFKEWPPIYLCANDEEVFDHSAIENQGDSLVYKLCTPYAGATIDKPKPQPPSAPPYSQVQFLAPHSQNDPIVGANVKIDPNTGLLSLKPGVVGQYLVGVCVEEYRDGELISMIHRDFEYNVRICIKNPIADFEAIEDENSDGLSWSFINKSTGIDYKWYFEYPDTTKSSTEIDPVYTYTCAGQYEVMLIARDGSCLDTARMLLDVKDKNFSAAFDYSVEDCTEEVQVQLQDNSISLGPLLKREWFVNYGDVEMTFSEENPSFIVNEDQDSLRIKLLITSNKGCKDSTEVVIAVQLIQLELSGDTSICLGDNITILSNGDPDLEYTWIPETGLDLTDPHNPIASPEETTEYRVIATDGLCTVERSLTLTVVEETVFEIIGDSTICTDTVSLTHNLPDGLTAEWFLDSLFTQSLGTANPITITDIPEEGITVYALLLDDVCESSASFRVDRKDFSIQTEENLSICEGDTFQLELIPSDQDFQYTFEWQPSDYIVTGGNTASPWVLFDQGGQYELTYSVTNEYGCNVTDSVNINVTALPVINLQKDWIVCIGDTIALNPEENAAYNYEWSSNMPGLFEDNQAVNPVVVINDTTVIEVIISTPDELACSIKEEIVVNTAPLIVMELVEGDQIICLGDTVQLSVLTSEGIEVQWYDEMGNLISTENSIYETPEVNSVYTVVGTDQYGCRKELMAEVDIAPSINLLVSDNTLICPGDSTVLIANSAVEVSYQWFDEDQNIISENDMVVVTPASTTNFKVVATDQFGCTEEATITIEVAPEIELELSEAQTICREDSVQLVATSAVDVNYQWYDEMGNLLSEEESIIVAPVGSAIYIVHVTDQYGCVEKDSVMVIIAPDIELMVSEDQLICPGDSVVLSASANEEVGYEWRNEDGVLLSSMDSVTVSPDSSSTFFVTATNQLGCQSVAQIIIEVAPRIELAVLDDQLICYGDSIVLRATVAVDADFEWLDADGSVISFLDSVVVHPAADAEYRVIATDQYGCQEENSIVISVTPAIDFDLTEDQLICFGDSIQLSAMSDLELEYQWRDMENNLLSEESSITVSPEESTSYKISVMDEFGCTKDSVVQVEVAPEIALERTEDQLICFGDSIVLKGSAAVDVDFEWLDAADNVISSIDSVVVNPKANATYHVIVTDQFGCQEEDSITISVAPEIKFDLTEDQLICFGDTTELNANSVLELSYQWYDQDDSLLSEENSVVVNPEVSTSYTVIATDEFGCTEESSVVVEVAPEIALEATENHMICYGDTILLSASGAVELSFEWYDSEDNLISTADSVIVHPEVSTIYRVVATDQFNCMEETEVDIVVTPAIQLEVSGDQLICYGDSIRISGSAAVEVSYQWYNEEDSLLSEEISLTVMPFMSATYRLVVTDEFGCIEEKNVFVEVTPEISLSASEDQLICKGDSIQLLASGAVELQFEWYDEEGNLISTNDSVTVHPDETTAYRVVATDQFNCTEEITVQVEIAPAIQLEISEGQLICYGDSILLSGSAVEEVTFQWFDMDGNLISELDSALVKPLATTSYRLLATDQYGCQEEKMVGIVVTLPIEYNLSEDQLLCYGDSTQLTVSSATEYDYQWADQNGNPISNNSSISVSPLTNTFYSLTITDEFGCTVEEEVVIEVAPAINLTSSEDQLICPGDSLQLIAAGDVELDFEWYDSDGNLIAETDSVVVSPDASAIYRVVVTDQNNCSQERSVAIEVPPSIQLAVSEDQLICPGESVELQSTTEVEPVEHKWYDEDGNVLGRSASLVVSPDSNSIYTIVVTDEYNCTEEVSVFIEIAPIIQFSVPDDQVICEGDTVELIASAENVDVQWLDAAGNILGESDTLYFAPESDQMLTVLAIDNFGCSASDSVLVSISPPINLVFSDNTIDRFCEGSEINLEVFTSTETTVVWQSPDGDTVAIGHDVVFTPFGMTMVHITATDAAGCQDTLDLTLNPFVLDMQFSSDQLICAGDQVTISAINLDETQVFEYLWTPVEAIMGDNTLEFITVNPDTTTEFRVFLRNQVGCLWDASILVEVDKIDPPVEIFAEEEEILLGQSVQLEASTNPNLEYEWSPSEFLDNPSIYNPIATTIDEFTTFSVTVTNENGCTSTAQLDIRTIQPQCNEEDIFVPNMFTPNNDGLNDVFRVESNFIKELSMIIYNRWGEQIFESRSQDDPWDGKVNGDGISPDVFGYYLEIICINDLQYVTKGNVTVMK